MKHLFTLVLLSLFSLPLAAQAASDYILFRPGVQYIYTNEIPGSSNFFEAPESELLGMKLDSTNIDSLGRYQLYQMPRLNRVSLCYTLRPSFAGTSIAVTPDSTTMYFDGENVASQLLVIHAAPVGISWSAAPGVTGRVDSVREVIFRERLTSVKYISLLDSTSNNVLAILPLSRDLGLLIATDFYRLRAIDQWSSPLVSTNTPALGPQLPSLDDIFNIPVGTQLSVGEVRSKVLRTYWYFQHTYRNLMVERVRPDTVLGGFEIDLLYDENNYRIAPDEGDSIYNAQRGYNQRITWSYPSDRIDGLNQQPGAAFVVEDMWGKSLSVTRAGFSSLLCTEIGRGIQGLGYCRADIEPGCFSPPSDNADSGLYFANAAGPYGYLGSLSYYDKILGQVRNETFDCGSPYDLSVSSRRFTHDERIRLYPNPASDQVTIEIPDDLGEVSLRLISADGRMVRSLEGGRGNQTVQLGALPTGVYTVVVANGRALIGRRRLVVR